MPNLDRAVNIEDLRRLARKRLPRAIFDFFDGGAEDEVTLRGNRAAFERVRLLPRVLVDVSTVETVVDLFGKPSSLPLAIAPTGGISAGRAGAGTWSERMWCGDTSGTGRGSMEAHRPRASQNPDAAPELTTTTLACAAAGAASETARSRRQRSCIIISPL